MTRSKAKSGKFQKIFNIFSKQGSIKKFWLLDSHLAEPQVIYIPVGIKLFKLIVNELCSQLETASQEGDESEDEV